MQTRKKNWKYFKLQYSKSLFKIFSALARVISKEESFKTKYLGISISIENFKFPLTLVDLKFLYFFNLVSLVEIKVSSILCLEMQNESILVKAVQIRMPLLVSVESSKKTILCFLGLLITGDILTVQPPWSLNFLNIIM